MIILHWLVFPERYNQCYTFSADIAKEAGFFLFPDCSANLIIGSSRTHRIYSLYHSVEIDGKIPAAGSDSTDLWRVRSLGAIECFCMLLSRSCCFAGQLTARGFPTAPLPEPEC